MDDADGRRRFVLVQPGQKLTPQAGARRNSAEGPFLKINLLEMEGVEKTNVARRAIQTRYTRIFIGYSSPCIS